MQCKSRCTKPESVCQCMHEIGVGCCLCVCVCGIYCFAVQNYYIMECYFTGTYLDVIEVCTMCTLKIKQKK